MDRKEILKALEEHFGVKPKYLGVPSCAYQIETEDSIYTIDREGKIINSEGTEVELEVLLKGKVQEEINEPAPKDMTTIELAVPMEGHTGITLRNLVNMVYSKQDLIKKSLGIKKDIMEDDFCIGINKAKMETLEDFETAVKNIVAERCAGITFDFADRLICFKLLEGESSSEKIQTCGQFVELLNKNAKELKRVSAKAKDTDNDKFTFRVFLIRLGMVGDEYKMARKLLLDKLEGNSAFRSGKKPEKVVTEETE